MLEKAQPGLTGYDDVKNSTYVDKHRKSPRTVEEIVKLSQIMA